MTGWTRFHNKLAPAPLPFLLLILLNNLTSPSPSAALSFSNSTLFSCPTELTTPTLLDSFSGGKLLVSPTLKEGELCILSRVNRNSSKKKVYIPIARSYDGNDWHRVAGRYISHVDTVCKDTEEGEYLCEIQVPDLKDGNVGYFLTRWEEKNVSDRRVAARFLERASWGARWNEIKDLENEIALHGKKALATWIKNQQSLPPSSHRAFFRQRLNPRTVESYLYGIPGPKVCQENARFRRFAFTYKDMELSRGTSGSMAGNNCLPFSTVEIETLSIDGREHYVVKFGGQIRTILPSPLVYQDNGVNVTVPDGNYTICHAEEIVGDRVGGVVYENNVQFQLLVGDLCTSSYTDRDGVDDGKGDGSNADDVKVGGVLARIYDKNACDAKCSDTNKVKLILGGNPEVIIPDGFDKSAISWIDLVGLNDTEIININAERTHDSSWLLQKNLDTCLDQNGDEMSDPAGMAYTDLSSLGRGKYNMDKPTFARLPGDKWALHDLRTLFQGNTLDDPLKDGGGKIMKLAARSGENDDRNPDTDLVVRCSNAPRNVFNEEHCRISYDEDACVSVPLPVDGRVVMDNPSRGVDEVDKYLPPFAGPENGGVVVCGSPNEVAPIPTEDDHFDVTNRKVQPAPIDYMEQKRDVFVEVVLGASDQLCQRLAFGLSKIFATSTNMNSDVQNTETNIGVYDNFVTSCFSTYKDVMKKMSFNQEMSEQLTFLGSKSVASDWHKRGILAWPDENYARENLQLHSIGLLKLNDDGTPVLDRFGKPISNYEQKHIYSAAKVWTGFRASYRRGNYEDLDWATSSYLDPLQITDVSDRDWFPKITTDGGYLGDKKYPLCEDLPMGHFLKKGATYRLLGGSSTPLSHNDPSGWEGDEEVARMSLSPDSQLYSKLCNPTGAPNPSSTLTPGTGLAEYDESLSAPICKGLASSCDSAELLVGRTASAIDGCAGGEDDTVSYNESVKRIIVSSVNGGEMRGGTIVSIQATVISFSKYDRVDYFYASNASVSALDWKFITTVAPLVGESNVTVPYSTFPEITYTLPKCLSISGCRQAVRVVLRSSRDPQNPSKSTSRLDSYLKPSTSCPTAPYDDVDDVAFDVLPTLTPGEACSFETIVTLDENLECEGRECAVHSVRVVEVMPGVFYEYLPFPCVHLAFYNDAAKVFSVWSSDFYMCANKQLPSARSTCCGSYTDRDLSFSEWADVLSEYRGERLTYNQNHDRCTDWDRTICDPQRIGRFFQSTGHCLHRNSCSDIGGSDTYITSSAYHWTTGGCSIRVKVDPDGLIAIVHEPEQKWLKWNSQQYPKVQSHVNENKTVSYFHVNWESVNVDAGKVSYPHVTDNTCDGGTVVTGDFCICDTAVVNNAVFDSTPTRDEALEMLRVGAVDPMVMYENEYTVIVETDADDGVSVYSKAIDEHYSDNTIFRIKHDNSYIFLKNVESTVKVCNGTFLFRNPPTFFDIVDPQLISAHHETEAYLDYVDSHNNTPPFVCMSLMKHFGYSNPSPHHVLGCSEAYKTGVFTCVNPADSFDTVSFGSGKRGDLRAVSASILLSEDALSVTLDADPTFGGVKEPLHKLMQVMRSLGFERSLTHRRLDGLITSYTHEAFGQAPYSTPDQFSFFSPDYSPTGAHIESSLVSPESELLNMRYLIQSQNALYALIQDGLSSCNGGIGPASRRGIIHSCWSSTSSAVGHLNFTVEENLFEEANPISQLSTLLTADRLNTASREIIETVYSETLSSKGEEQALQAAQALLVSTPEFHTTNLAMPLNEERESSANLGPTEDSDYKAIIHLNLFGGMDSMNLLVPHPDACPELFDEYKARRGESLYLSTDEIIKIDSSTSDQPCASFGINKRLGQEFADMYTEGELIFFANIGHLQKPVTAKNFLAETTAQLFSHYDMRLESFKVDAFDKGEGTGILGRMIDIIGSSTSSSKSAIDSSSSNLYGDPMFEGKVDVISSRGPQDFFSNDKHGIKNVISKLNNATTDTSGIHADLWSQSFVDSRAQTDKFRAMLDTISGPYFISGDGLGKPLEMIAKFMKLREVREVKRDTFALSWGGFDTHFNLKDDLGSKFDSLGVLLKQLRQELINLGLWDSTTLVISSEMGRSISPNSSSGTDHGWGGHNIIMGGQVKGGKILGHHPHTYDAEWEYDTGRGVWIPTIPNEAMWLGISQWFGIEKNEDLSQYVLPNMNNFGCRLYSEADLYKKGMGKVPGCGGDVIQFSQVLYLSESRQLNPDEQSRYCSKVLDSATDIGIALRCVILDQVLGTKGNTGGEEQKPNLFQGSPSNLGYTLDIIYEITSDSTGISNTVKDILDSSNFKEQVASAIEMDVSVESVSIKSETTQTQSPTQTQNPTESSMPSTSPTFTPSVNDVTSAVPSVDRTGSPTDVPAVELITDAPFSMAPATTMPVVKFLFICMITLALW